MRMLICSTEFFFFILLSTISSSPLCHDTIPFSTKLSQSSFVVTGDLINVESLSFVNNQTKSFNMTLIVRCLLKGEAPAEERILIEHTPPENPRCYRTLSRGDFYIFFLNETKTKSFYKQMPFHELSFNDETTIEILKRTCGLNARSLNDENRCPIVSFGCE